MVLALVQDNQVVGILDTDDLDLVARVSRLFGAAVDITDMSPRPQIGWRFDGLRFSRQDGSAPIDWRVTRLAFRQRFTLSELVGITLAAGSDPLISVIVQNQAIAVYVDLSESATQAGLMLLVSKGLLTLERAGEILGTVPQLNELAFDGSLRSL